MIVVEPVEEDEPVDDEWQGSINELASITKRQISELNKALSRKSDKM